MIDETVGGQLSRVLGELGIGALIMTERSVRTTAIKSFSCVSVRDVAGAGRIGVSGVEDDTIGVVRENPDVLRQNI